MAIKNISIRLATREDIPDVVTLVLTSYRRFPLFDFLYQPLHNDINNANDTLYFWDRRMRKTLLDPSSRLIVAEIDSSASPQESSSDERSADKESWRMVDWLTEKNLGTGVTSGRIFVGFALWRFEGEDAPSSPRRFSLTGKIQGLVNDSKLENLYINLHRTHH